MNILGLDLSLSSTGYCLPDGTTGRIRPKLKPKNGAPTSEQLDRVEEIVDRVGGLIVDFDVSFAVIEGFAFSRHNTYAREIGALGYMTRSMLNQHGIGWVDPGPTKMKRYATGKGNAGKDEVIASVVRRFGEHAPSNNDEADAFVLWHMAMDADGRPLVQLPKTQRDALSGVEWPFPCPGVTR